MAESQHLTDTELLEVAFGAITLMAPWRERWLRRHHVECGLCRGKLELLRPIYRHMPDDRDDASWDRLWLEVEKVLACRTEDDLRSLRQERFEEQAAPVTKY